MSEEKIYTMQVRVIESKECGCVGYNYVWRDVRPTNGKRYEYPTHAKALSMLNMCYPDCTSDEVRVKEHKI